MRDDTIWPDEIRGNKRSTRWLNKLLRACRRASITDIKVVGGNSKIQNGIAIISTQPPNPMTPPVLPFEIYNIANVLNPADSWRTFQIRDGFLGARSKYWLNGFDSLNNPDPSPYWFNNYLTNFKSNQNYGNFETFLAVVQDASGIGSDTQNIPQSQNKTFVTSQQIKLDLTTDVLISGVDGAGNYVSYGQIVMADGIVNVASADPSFPIASFWIEIIDDPTLGFYANLWGRMCGKQVPGQSPPQQSITFPSGKNIIPIGMVEAGTNSDQAISPTLTPSNESFYYQALIGNLIGRFPALLGTGGIGNASFYRGKYVADGLVDQVFYPGDIVVDDTVSDEVSNTLNISGGATGFVYSYPVYVCNGDADQPFFASTNPTADGAKWTQVSSLIVNKP